MSEEKRIKDLLAALGQRLRNGEISRQNYERLKTKYQDRLTRFQSQITVTCANCGETIRVDKNKKQTTCSSCGYTNKMIREEKARKPEEQLMNTLASIQERLRDYKHYREKVGPEAMEIIRHDLAQARFKISSENSPSAKFLMQRAYKIEEQLEVLERYYEDYERFEELGVNPDCSLNVTFKAVVPDRNCKTKYSPKLEEKATSIAVGEAYKLELEEMSNRPFRGLGTKEVRFYLNLARVRGSSGVLRSEDPLLNLLEDIDQRNRMGGKISDKEKKLLELYTGWDSKIISTFRVPEADVILSPTWELLFSIEEQKKGVIRKKVKRAAVDVWKIARVWIPHWRIRYSSVMGQHSSLLGSLAGEGFRPPVTKISLCKGEFLSPTVEGNPKEWFRNKRNNLLTASRRLTSYERRFKLWTKEEDYFNYAYPVLDLFDELGLKVQYQKGFLKMGLKIEGRWLQKGEYEKIAASLELSKIDYVYLPAYFGLIHSKTTYCVWYYLLSLANGVVAILNQKHPIVEIAAKKGGYR